jgi:hypothetical protein
MSRKVKVVPVENVETIKLSPEPEVPEAEPEIQAPEPEVTPEIENTSSDKTEVVEAPKEVVEAPKEAKTKKQDEKMTCPVCNKTMLSKTYKYTHQALCRPKEPEPKVPQPKPKKEPKTKTKDIPNVSFNDFKEMKEVMPAPPPDYAAQYKAARDQRQQVRTQRVKSLILQAI